MRLIDADQAASIENLDQYSDLAAALGDVQTVRDILSDAPTISAVPVVRCRECVHNHPEFVGNETQWCELCRTTINLDDFCSRGQRKIETVLSKSDEKDESLEGDQ